jgi:hypothetical protein
MAQSHTDQLRQDLNEIRKSVETCRRELGVGEHTSDARRTGPRRSGGLLRAFRGPRQHPLA